MKKLLSLLSLVLILSACSFGNGSGNETGEIIENQYILSDDYKYVDSVKGFSTNSVEITNDSTMKLGSENLNVFYKESIYMPYLEFENYVNLMKETLDEDIIILYEKDRDTWTVKFNEEDGDYIKFDFMDNTVELSSIYIIDSAFKMDESASELTEYVEKYYKESEEEEINPPSSITIDLTDYNIELTSTDGNHLVPMHLLFFLFSAYDNDFYYTGENAYYGDIFSEESKILYPIVLGSKDMEYDQMQVDFSTNFNKLVFENFYGLKDIREGYVENLEATRKVEGYREGFADYIIDLEDGHTSVALYAYGVGYDNLFSLTPKLEENMKEYLTESERLGCDESDEKVTYEKLSDKTVLVDVPSLSSPDFSENYFEVLDEVRDYENIVLDIKCNGGGYLANAPFFVYPFVDEPVVLNYEDITGAQFTTPYEKMNASKGIRTIKDANVYLITSDATFSAANLSTSLFKEQGIGKVIGEKSGGGTAAIALVSSPNGSILSMSFGSYIITNTDFEMIEDGFEPDIPFVIDMNNFKETILSIVEE